MALHTSFIEPQVHLPSLLFVCAILVWLIPKVYVAYTSPLRKIPGPYYTRYTNLPLKFAVVTGQRIYHIHALHKAYGSVVRISPTEISISDPDAFRTIHRAGSGFLKSEFYARFVNQPVPGIFDMSDPKQHATRRKLFARALSKSEIRTRWEDMVWSKAKLAMQKLKDEMAEGQADVLKWLFFLATDVNANLMFGESFRTLENGRKNQYIDTLQSVAKGGGINVELPLVGLIGRLLPYTLFRAKDYILDYGRHAVAKSRAPGSDSASIFTQLESNNEPGSKDASSHLLTELDLATEASNLIIAGTDTTAFTMTYLIWAVLLHPRIQFALEAEVGALNDGYREADLEELPLLNAVIKETLRLYGAVPGSLPRVVPAGGREVGAYSIPEGTIVSTQSWTLHRDEKLWKDAETFDPERWLANPAPDAGKAIWAPFGAGSRICIGLHLAMMEIRIATTLFFRQFRGAKLAPTMAVQGLQFDNFFLIKPKGGACFIVAN